MESKHVDEIYKRVMKNIEIARIYAVGANNVSFTSSSPASLNTQSDLLVSHRGASASPTVQPARSGRSGFTKSKSIGTKNSPSNLVITTGSGNTKSKSNPATSPTLSSSVGATKAGASSPPSLEGSGSGSGSSNGKAKKAALAAVKSSLARQAEEDPTALVDKLVNRINDTEERSQKLVEKFRTLQNSYSVVFNEQFRPFDYRAPFPRPVLPTSEKPRLDVICFFFGPVETTKVSTFTTTDPDWNAFKDVNTDRFSKELQLFSSLSKISLDKVILAHAFPHVISKNKGLVEDRQMELAILWTKEVLQNVSPNVVISVGSITNWAVHSAIHPECKKPSKDLYGQYDSPSTSPNNSPSRFCKHQGNSFEKIEHVNIVYFPDTSYNSAEKIRELGEQVKTILKSS
eukprot:TRINITY_DN1441_c0_g1_i3.p1 TRINITY_DN1441_c0_g1~~TRINITY_DN1441_c0_g1_i3.p1  ORF type:complete len:402 (+),score=80.68 TRINITY_DN1441_c0_g1_i3:241-1446(+)